MKEKTQEIAIVPSPESTAELIPHPTAETSRKVLCQKHPT